MQVADLQKAIVKVAIAVVVPGGIAALFLELSIKKSSYWKMKEALMSLDIIDTVITLSELEENEHFLLEDSEGRYEQFKKLEKSEHDLTKCEDVLGVPTYIPSEVYVSL